MKSQIVWQISNCTTTNKFIIQSLDNDIVKTTSGSFGHISMLEQCQVDNRWLASGYVHVQRTPVRRALFQHLREWHRPYGTICVHRLRSAEAILVLLKIQSFRSRWHYFAAVGLWTALQKAELIQIAVGGRQQIRWTLVEDVRVPAQRQKDAEMVGGPERCRAEPGHDPVDLATVCRAHAVLLKPAQLDVAAGTRKDAPRYRKFFVCPRLTAVFRRAARCTMTADMPRVRHVLCEKRRQFRHRRFKAWHILLTRLSIILWRCKSG